MVVNLFYKQSYKFWLHYIQHQLDNFNLSLQTMECSKDFITIFENNTCKQENNEIYH